MAHMRLFKVSNGKVIGQDRELGARGEGVGNGMACAIMFAREGAKVVLVNRSAERAEGLAKQIKDEGGEASVFAGDVAWQGWFGDHGTVDGLAL